MQPNTSLSDQVANLPNTSLMGLTYTPTFGNISFAFQPSMSGEVNNTFGILPYISLEGLLYQQQVQAATTLANTTGMAVTGQNNVSGSITSTDGTGNVRVAISGGGSGNQTTAGGF